ncbi:MAG TPA: 23S rRNA (adenine(2503)-C(2))-methyltransferase RlmN [Candidatus Acidoferrales bacterium]|nr:23S rRNA (adenine(2503)-C(2))-methyltransferase RlmN [Candidatus Acidoferrales bacterium]
MTNFSGTTPCDLRKTNLFGKTEKELEEFFTGIGEPPYRGRQIFGWLYKKQVESFDRITDFTKSLRSKLSEIAEIKYPEIIGAEESGLDGTTKFLLRLADGGKVETVLIPKEKSPDDQGAPRQTICVSTQVGCALDCTFCATGSMKFMRNLTVGEIISQVVIGQRHTKKRITNVVFMGMGEPLLNHEAVLNAIRVLTDDRSMNIRAKGITVSTAGVVDKIPLLAAEPIKFRLAISLHSLVDEVRTFLMPINKKYKLERLLSAAKEFARARRDRITFEYILFDGLNDTDTDAERLIKLSRDIPLKVNLLRYHPLDHLSRLGLKVDPLSLKLRPSGRIEEFANRLRENGITAFVRSNAGEDINGACGQLAAKNIRSHKAA